MGQQEDFSKYNGEGTTLRKAQLRMLEILIEVDKICRKHNIPYWIDAGTLLGAVRHGGFIPWDDDVDVNVLWKDYKKLRKILPQELPENLFFQDWKSEKALFQKAAKVTDSRTIYIEDVKHQVPGGLFVDIFPMKHHLSFRIRRYVDYFYGRCFRRMRDMNDSLFEKLIAYILIIPTSFVVWLSEGISALLKTDKIGHPFGGYAFDVNMHRKISEIFPLSTISFEGHQFPCPKNADAYLHNQYGDYMQISPEDKRQVHALKIEFLDE